MEDIKRSHYTASHHIKKRVSDASTKKNVVAMTVLNAKATILKKKLTCLWLLNIDLINTAPVSKLFKMPRLWAYLAINIISNVDVYRYGMIVTCTHTHTHTHTRACAYAHKYEHMGVHLSVFKELVMDAYKIDHVSGWSHVCACAVTRGTLWFSKRSKSFIFLHSRKPPVLFSEFGHIGVPFVMWPDRTFKSYYLTAGDGRSLIKCSVNG